jgi:hypothetical protein
METKMTSVLNTLIFLTVTLMMTACHGKASMPAERAEGDTIVMRHARNLCLIQHADYTEAVIRNPWDTTQVLSSYILTEKALGQTRRRAHCSKCRSAKLPSLPACIVRYCRN